MEQEFSVHQWSGAGTHPELLSALHHTSFLSRQLRYNLNLSSSDHGGSAAIQALWYCPGQWCHCFLLPPETENPLPAQHLQHRKKHYPQRKQQIISERPLLLNRIFLHSLVLS